MKHTLISLMEREIIQASWGAFQMEDQTGETCQEKKRQRMKEYIRLSIRQDLTPRQRECVVAYYLEEIPVAKIAERMGVTHWTVYKHLERGIRRIQQNSRYLIL